MQGGPIHWAATHRLHHAKVDQEGDPHSPVVNSFLWSHVIWNFFNHPDLKTEEQLRHLAPDLYDDKGYLFFQKHFLLINILFGLFAVGLAWILGGWKIALSLFVWGGLLRVVAVWNSTWLVNSATHVWGYRNYDSLDQSRNNWLVAFLCLGEGWHNNHHANPQVASNQHRWFELDVTFWVIYLMSLCGLISDIALLKKKVRNPIIKTLIKPLAKIELEPLIEPLPKLKSVN